MPSKLVRAHPCSRRHLKRPKTQSIRQTQVFSHLSTQQWHTVQRHLYIGAVYSNTISFLAHKDSIDKEQQGVKPYFFLFLCVRLVVLSHIAGNPDYRREISRDSSFMLLLFSLAPSWIPYGEDCGTGTVEGGRIMTDCGCGFVDITNNLSRMCQVCGYTNIHNVSVTT